MGKSDSEIAGEITVAWLAALGSLATSQNFDAEAYKELSDSDNVANFFRTIYNAINKRNIE